MGGIAVKKAILAVSFGTTHLDTLERTIGAIEGDLAAAFPDRALARAFTSGMVRRRLLEREGLRTDSPGEALERLQRAGYGDVVVQSTHVMNGEEWEKLVREARPYGDRFAALSFGSPLLTEAADYQAAAGALLERLPPAEAGQAVVFMGHGTEHHANAVYALLEYILHDMGRRDIHIGTVEGYPGFGEVCRRIGEQGDVERVLLLPLMIVAGDHAKNDLAGEDAGSWRAMLAKQGLAVDCRLEGLGENPAVRSIFVAHARRAAELSGGRQNRMGGYL